MGVNFNCYVFYGLSLEAEDFKELISPAVYEDQPRYDTRTGQVVKTERVLVKEEQAVYKMAGLEDVKFYSLVGRIARKFDLDIVENMDGVYFVGYNVFETEGYEQNDLADGTCDLDTLKKYHADMLEKFPDLEEYIGLHAIPVVG